MSEVDAFTRLLRRRRGAPEDPAIWTQLVAEARRRGLLPTWELAPRPGAPPGSPPGFDRTTGLPEAWRVPGLSGVWLHVPAPRPLWVASTPLQVGDVRAHIGHPVGYVAGDRDPAPFVTALQARELAAVHTQAARDRNELPARWRLDLPDRSEWQAAAARFPALLPHAPRTFEWTRDRRRPPRRPGAEAVLWVVAGTPGLAPQGLGERDSAPDVFARLVLRGVAPW